MSNVAVVGAGPVGLAVALALTDAGHQVGLVAPDSLGAGWAAGGLLSPRFEVAMETGIPVSKLDGAGHWLLDQGAIALGLWEGLVQRAGAERPAPVKALTTDGIEHVTGDCVIDPRAWLARMLQMVRARGVIWVKQLATEVLEGRVQLGAGSISGFDTIVVAPGFSGAPLVPELGALVPVSGQLARVEGRFLEGALRHGSTYVIDRGDHTVIGATSRPGDDTGQVEGDAIAPLLERAALMVPELAGMACSDSWAGVRPVSPDGLPLVGWSGVPGVAIAGGTGRNGWLLAPLIGQWIVRLLAGEELDPGLDPGRFRS